jgi:hypothetical protein
VNGHLHALAFLTLVMKTAVTTGYEDGWTTVGAWTWCREKSWSLQRIQPCSSSPVALLTELSHITSTIQSRFQMLCYTPMESKTCYAYISWDIFKNGIKTERTAGLAQRYRAGLGVFESRKGAGNLSLHHRLQTSSGAHPASYPTGTRGSFPGGKVVGALSWPLVSI